MILRNMLCIITFGYVKHYVTEFFFKGRFIKMSINKDLVRYHMLLMETLKDACKFTLKHLVIMRVCFYFVAFCINMRVTEKIHYM